MSDTGTFQTLGELEGEGILPRRVDV